MSWEIERKYLVKDNNFFKKIKPIKIVQGYMSIVPERVVRIRIYGDTAFITIKGKQDNYSRREFEYEIPLNDAQIIIEKMCLPSIIKKNRYLIDYDEHTWEIDEYLDDNNGLVTAEIELSHENEIFELPDWIDIEISHDYRYSNINLSNFPYNKWEKS